MIHSFIDALFEAIGFKRVRSTLSRVRKYQILLTNSSWYKNIHGNAWYSLSEDDAKYQLNLLRKRGML